MTRLMRWFGPSCIGLGNIWDGCGLLIHLLPRPAYCFLPSCLLWLTAGCFAVCALIYFFVLSFVLYPPLGVFFSVLVSCVYCRLQFFYKLLKRHNNKTARKTIQVVFVQQLCHPQYQCSMMRQNLTLYIVLHTRAHTQADCTFAIV